MIAEHVAPVLQALRTSGSPALTVFDGPVGANTVPPYAVAYFTVTTPEPTTFEDVYDRVQCTATIHSVGGNADSVRVVAGRVLAALLAFRPTVAGRDCSRLTLIDSQPASRDETTGQVVLNQVDVYQYVSVPA